MKAIFQKAMLRIQLAAITFIVKAKVFLAEEKILVSGIIGAMILVLQQFLGKPPVEPKALATAILLALMGTIGQHFKGRGFTMLGIIGTVLGVAHNIASSGTFTWNEFILSSAVAILMLMYPGGVPGAATAPQLPTEKPAIE